MFRFLELELHGWDLWPAFRVPLDAGIVIISGPNGSGKTTLLDAIRQLLNAPRLSQHRRIAHYLRQPNQPVLIRAVVSNRPESHGRRPFERQRILSDEATLACVLIPHGASPEKRFAVLPGRISAPDLQQRLLDGKEWLSPEQYARILDYAGVSRSLMHILALEQGRADELSRRTPRELFTWVMEARGSQEVLERYKGARQRYEESSLEIARQREHVQQNQVEVTRLERLIRRLDEYNERQHKVAEAQVILAAARYQRLFQALQDVEHKLPEQRTRTVNLVTAVDRLKREIADSEKRIHTLKECLQLREEESKTAIRECDAALQQQTRLQVEVERLRTYVSELSQIPFEDIAALETELEKTRRTIHLSETDLDKVTKDLENLRARIAELERGIPQFPIEVKRTLEALNQAGIQATLAAVIVEIKNENWATVIESALGPLRFALAVSPENESRALVLARENAFPGPIVTDLSKESVLTEFLQVGAGSPVWLGVWAKNIQFVEDQLPPGNNEVLSRNGLHRDRFGIWTSRASEHVLGGQAIRKQLEESLQRKDLLVSIRDRSKQLIDQNTHQLKIIDERIKIQKHRLELTQAIKAIPSYEQELIKANKLVSGLQSARDHAQAILLDSRLELLQAETNFKNQRTSLDEKEDELKKNRITVVEMEKDQSQLAKQLEETQQTVSSELKVRAEAGNLSTPEMAEQDLKHAHEALDRFIADAPIPSENVREEHKLLLRNLEELEQHIRDRQREVDAAFSELKRCRGDYLEVIRSTLHDYSRRAHALGELASSKLEIDLPVLENTDRSVDEAEIVVRIGFDGKPPTEIGDTAHSGGQNVISGLVLLMAIAETEGDGFFMIDEPFAHLSLDRVDDVGKFLRRSGAQFLITVPTTLDRGQLDPASLLIVLSKKGPDKSFASPPLVARV